MNRLLRWVVAAAVPLLLHPAPAMSAVDLFLKIDTIKGESKDDRHKDWIDLLSYSFGASNSGSFSSGGGGGAGGATFQDFSFTKFVDASSPHLFLAVAKGTRISKAILDVVEPSAKAGTVIVKYTLEDVLVTSFLQSGDGGGLPVDSFSLAYAKLTVSSQTVELPVPIPEPSTWALLIAGLAFLALRARRLTPPARRRAAA